MNRAKSQIARLLSVSACLILLPISPAHAAVLPTAPTSITATAGEASVAVTWAAPAYVGDGVSAYSIDYSTDGSTWVNASNTISNLATSYTISALTPNAGYYIRMAALNAGSPGPYGYPWSLVYAITNPNRNASAGIDYATNNSNALSAAVFSRVKYRLAFTRSATNYYSEADMAKWDTSTLTNTGGTYTSSPATVSNLRVPSADAGNGFQIHTNVSDLTVVSSDSTLNTSGKTGRLEIWPWNYGPDASSLTPAGTTNTYDYDDYPMLSAGYGSFQVHNATNAKTILAWNNHANGLTAEIGIGNWTTNPDWTFCSGTAGACTTPTNFRVEISINPKVVPTTPSSTSISLVASGTATYRAQSTITANTSVAGKVTFFANGKRIPSCVSIRTVTNTSVNPYTFAATCSWKPSLHGQITLTASFIPNSGPNSSGKVSAPVIASKRITTR